MGFRRQAMTTAEKAIRKQLVELLRGGQAHATFEDVVKNFPPNLRGVVPAGLPYSAWQVLEHIRIAQDDIVRFSTNHDGRYRSPKWPEGYWPVSAEPPEAKSWERSVQQVQKDRDQMIRLVSDPANDLLTTFPWGEEQNLLRETLLVADHTSHHLGELIVIRRLLGAWPAK
jgi:DinB superfamily